jgi:hypothetical protein
VNDPSSVSRHVDTPEFVLTAAHTLIGWGLQHYQTTYSPARGVQVELQFVNRGGTLIPRSAFRSNAEWEVIDMHAITRSRMAVVWLRLRRRLGG